MSRQKKLTEMDREELLAVVHNLVLVISRKKGADLQPNREANRRHQRHKHIWGRKKLHMLDLLDRCQEHVLDPDLAAEIDTVLDHEENHYQRRDASTRRRREVAQAAKQNGGS